MGCGVSLAVHTPAVTALTTCVSSTTAALGPHAVFTRLPQFSQTQRKFRALHQRTDVRKETILIFYVQDFKASQAVP